MLVCRHSDRDSFSLTAFSLSRNGVTRAIRYGGMYLARCCRRIGQPASAAISRSRLGCGICGGVLLAERTARTRCTTSGSR